MRSAEPSHARWSYTAAAGALTLAPLSDATRTGRTRGSPRSELPSTRHGSSTSSTSAIVGSTSVTRAKRWSTRPLVWSGYLTKSGTLATFATFARVASLIAPPGSKLAPWSAVTIRRLSS